jgi:glycosyltransferase involved in cell wall biosynthesis
MECPDRNDHLQTDLYGYNGVTPKVSIIFTAFNAEQYIEASVSAALAQDYNNFEVVVVDDGSTDLTERVCRGISDSRLIYLKRERMGRCAALNEAISQASGDFIAINDADDLSFPFRLSYVMNSFVTAPSLLLVGTSEASTNEFLRELPVGDHGEDGKPGGPLTILSKDCLYRGMPFVHSTTIFTKNAWRRVGGYNEKLTICVDYDFVLRVARIGDIGFLPKKTVLLFINRSSFYRTKNTIVYLKTLFDLKKQFRRDYRISLKVRVQDLMYLKELIK